MTQEEKKELLRVGKIRLKKVIDKSTFENLSINIKKEIDMLYNTYNKIVEEDEQLNK